MTPAVRDHRPGDFRHSGAAQAHAILNTPERSGPAR